MMPSGLNHLLTPDRLNRGYVLVLPGIEGRSHWNRGIVRGLLAAQIPYAIEIHDWTYGRLFALYSLRSRQRHAEQSRLIAGKVRDYRRAHPEGPVWLIGHSGGGALSVLTLEQLATDVRAEGAILLAPALSPGYDLSRALAATRSGLWSFNSWGDAFFLMFGTLLLGTVDGRHTVSAGACGFRAPPADSVSRARQTFAAASGITTSPEMAPVGTARPDDGPRLTQVFWRPAMLRDWNLAGHFGAVNPRFVRRWIAPILAPPAVTSPAVKDGQPESLNTADRR